MYIYIYKHNIYSSQIFISINTYTIYFIYIIYFYKYKYIFKYKYILNYNIMYIIIYKLYI